MMSARLWRMRSGWRVSAMQAASRSATLSRASTLRIPEQVGHLFRNEVGR
jgi:hypothetical protein